MNFSFDIGNSQNSLTPNMELEKKSLGKGNTSTQFHVGFRGRILWFSIKLNPHVSPQCQGHEVRLKEILQHQGYGGRN